MAIDGDPEDLALHPAVEALNLTISLWVLAAATAPHALAQTGSCTAVGAAVPSNSVVTCTGTSYLGIGDGTQSNVTVNVEPEAALIFSGPPAGSGSGPLVLALDSFTLNNRGRMRANGGSQMILNDYYGVGKVSHVVINNDGSIEHSAPAYLFTSAAIGIYGSLFLNNTGYIYNTANAAISVGVSPSGYGKSGDSDIYNEGTIEGRNIAITHSGDRSLAVINAGVLKRTGSGDGAVVLLGSTSNDRFEIRKGSSIVGGWVDAGGGTDILALGGSLDETFSILLSATPPTMCT